MTLADRKSICLSAGNEASGDPEWSPDGKWIAYSGRLDGKSGLIVAHPDGSGKKYSRRPLDGTNAPLADHRQDYRVVARTASSIAYVTSQPGPETADATGDPIVITRYLYKPDGVGEGNSHFNDNKRLHIFVVDVASGTIETAHDRHALRALDRLVARSARRSPSSPIASRMKTSSSITTVLTLNAAPARLRRLTATENAEYRPRWSPDGKTIRLRSHQARPHRS